MFWTLRVHLHRLCNQAPFSISLITLTLFFEAQNLLVNVAMLLLRQSSVKCRDRKLEGSFMHIVRLPLLLSFYRPVTRVAELHALSSQRQGDDGIPRVAYCLENYFRMYGTQCLYIEVDARLYIVLSEAENTSSRLIRTYLSSTAS